MSYADWMSTAAFALSGVLAIREVREARADRPRITVTPELRFEPLTSDKVTLSLRVINHGRTPVTISDVGWELPQQGHTPARLTMGNTGMTPPLQRRIEGHDDVTWTWPETLVDKLMRFESFRGYADIFGFARRPTRRFLRRTDPSEATHRYYADDWFKSAVLRQMRDSVRPREGDDRS